MIYYKEEKKKLVIPSGFVMIPIDCDEAIEQAREQGYQEGFADGSSATCDTEEGTYSLTDDFDGEETVFPSEGKTGFNKIVIVDDGYGDKKYDEGYADGIADCSGSTPCDCTEAYQSGRTEGMAEQKALLSSTAITSNGTYTSENGWNSVNVNVPRFEPTEEKTLSLVEHSTGPWEVLASYPIGMSKVTVEDNGYGQGKYDEGYSAGLADCSGSTDCSSAITEAYQSGYTAGLADCSGSSCTLEEGQLAISDFWNGGPTVVYPFTADGFSQFTVEDTNGSYAYKHYMDGYNDGLAQCSGSSCLIEDEQTASLGYDWTGFTTIYPSQGYDGLGRVLVADLGYGQRKYDEGYADGHTSGYTEGYNEAITANCGSAITEAYESGVSVGYIDSSTKLAYFGQPAWVDTHNNTLFEEGDTLDMVFSFSGTHLQPSSNVIVHLFNNGSSSNTLNKSVFSIDFEAEQLFIYMYSCDGNGWKWAPFSSYGSTFSRYTGDTYHLIVRSYNNAFNEPSTQAILVNESRFTTYTGSTYNNSIHFSSGTTDSFRINCLYDEQNDTYSEMCSGLIVKSLKIYKQNGETNGNYHKTSLTTNMMWKDGKLLDTVTGEYNAYVYENGSAIVYSLPSIDDTLNILW